MLDEAETLIRTRGYAGFSYADLADRVGLRKASIHHHFPGKIDLGIALLSAYDARYDVEMARLLATSDDGLVRIRGYAALYLDGVEKGLGCLCAAFAAELVTLPERLRSDLARFFAKHIGWIETVLAAGQENGTIGDRVRAPACARMIVAALEGALMIERTLENTAGFGGVLSALDDVLRPQLPTAPRL